MFLSKVQLEKLYVFNKKENTSEEISDLAKLYQNLIYYVQISYSQCFRHFAIKATSNKKRSTEIGFICE